MADAGQKLTFIHLSDIHFVQDFSGQSAFDIDSVVPKKSERLLYCDHIEGDGEELFRLACEHDLEGVVAKRKADPYLLEHASWLKIRNHDYSQWVGREELFERERAIHPDFEVWSACALACAEAETNLGDAY